MQPWAGPQIISHESPCLLNTSDNDADVSITVYLANRERVRSLSDLGSGTTDETSSLQ